MKTLRTTLLTLSLGAVSFGGFACNRPEMTEEETEVGEASSSLTIAEESGDVTADASGSESDALLAVSADESAAVPGEMPEADGVCDLQARRARVVARYDVNENGQLERTELASLRADVIDRGGFAARLGIAHRRHVVRRLTWVFDANDDGSLSADERTALVDALEARCERIKANVLARFDANGDGSLDATERQAAKDAFRARLAAARAAVLAEYDTNTNGVLDDGERLALRAARLDAFRARKAQVVAQFDVNANGTLDDSEKAALRAAIEQRIIDGRDAE